MKTQEFVLLSEVATQVLETAAFALAEPSSHEAGSGTQPILRAQVGFSGPITGSIELLTSLDLATGLACDTLCLDADQVELPVVCDSLKELLNMIAGQWISAMCGVVAVVHLSVPEVGWLAGRAPDGTDEENTIVLAVDDQPIWLRLHLESIAEAVC